MALNNFVPPNDGDDYDPNDMNNNTPNNPFNNSSGGNGMPQGIPFPNNNQTNDDEETLAMLINYNKKFAKTDDILFRDDIIKQTMATLIGKSKPNPLLIGPAGVGKTKIVEDIAFKIANNSPLIPNQLINQTIYELPLSNLMANTSYRGQLEEKLNSLVDFLKNPKNKAILFIDEMHLLVTGGPSYTEVAQALKPALARGDIKVIGATTLQESSNLMSDPALNRRLSRLIVDELSQEQTIAILKQIRPEFIKHYKDRIKLTDEVIEATINLADSYAPSGSHRPDSAITLLDRAIGNVLVERKVMEYDARNDAALLQAIRSVNLIPITEKQVRETAIRLMTGNNKKSELDSKELENSFSKIIGQDTILEKISSILKKHELNLFPQKTPLTFLFAGASGVGKTEVTKILANQITGVTPITLNMTEYHSPASINRIIGSPLGYIGSDSNQELPFDILESNPYQIILLDEFEKCDSSVQRLFMSAFDEGFIKTHRGTTIDFSKSIIIATTNAANVDKELNIGFNKKTKNTTKENIKSLALHFDTELLNRFQHILTFNQLNKEVYAEILNNTYEAETSRIISTNHRIILEPKITDLALDEMLDRYIPEFGARPAQKEIRKYIEDQITI